jgi:hypothetical protein
MARKFTKKEILKKALRFNTRTEFKNAENGAYHSARKQGFLDEACAHMEVKRRNWTLKQLEDRAKNYTSLNDFMKKENGAYLWAMRNGFREKITVHMERKINRSGYWTIDNCRLEAKKYSNRSDFMRLSGSAYNVALKNEWVDEICAHMGSPADGYHHCVYAISNSRLNKAYIGITRQLVERRWKAHKSPNNSTRSAEISRLDDTVFLKLTDYDIERNEVKECELYWIKKYEDQGFDILNNKKNAGQTGTANRIYTDEVILAEALKYKRRVDFKKNSSQIYDAAVTQRLLEKACSHMRAIKPKNYWTKERCFELANSCLSQKEFRKSNGAYSAAKSNAWLQECYALIPEAPNDPWSRPNTRKDTYSNADLIYQIWVKAGKCGDLKIWKLTGIKNQRFINRLRGGWIPEKDASWRKWQSDEVENHLKLRTSLQQVLEKLHDE